MSLIGPHAFPHLGGYKHYIREGNPHLKFIKRIGNSIIEQRRDNHQIKRGSLSKEGRALGEIKIKSREASNEEERVLEGRSREDQTHESDHKK